jgi:hypothetical protein
MDGFKTFLKILRYIFRANKATCVNINKHALKNIYSSFVSNSGRQGCGLGVNSRGSSDGEDDKDEAQNPWEENFLKLKQSRIVNCVRWRVRRMPMLNRHLPIL